MTYRFPPQFSFFQMLALARKGLFDPAAFRGQVELDFSNLTFAGPGAMACIKALLAREQRELPPELCFPVTHQCQDAIRYLIRMDFFRDDLRWCFPEREEQFIRHSSEGRFLPIRNLHHLNETDGVSREMAKCLATDDRQTAATLQYALSELIDNALQHSDSPTGAFATAQKYERLKSVHLLIVDTGISIWRHLLKHPKYRHITSDVEAVKTALRPFVTGTYLADPANDKLEYENQGLGLSVTNEIARRCGGQLYLWTGKALYRSQNGEVEAMPVEWPGTVVFLTLPIKLAVNVTDVVKGFDTAVERPKFQLKFNP